MPDGATAEQPSHVSKKDSEYNSETGRGGGGRDGGDLNFSFQFNPEKSAQTQVVIETEQQIPSPMHESALS